MLISARITDRNLPMWRSVFTGFGVPSDAVRVRGPLSLAVEVRYLGHGTAADLDAERPLVVLQPPNGEHYKGNESLANFVHPPDAIYLFGSSHGHLTDEQDFGGRVPNHLVYIPAGKQLLDWVAGAVVLYDRTAKANA